MMSSTENGNQSVRSAIGTFESVAAEIARAIARDDEVAIRELDRDLVNAWNALLACEPANRDELKLLMTCLLDMMCEETTSEYTRLQIRDRALALVHLD